jgi:hypothetical protein
VFSAPYTIVRSSWTLKVNTIKEIDVTENVKILLPISCPSLQTIYNKKFRTFLNCSVHYVLIIHFNLQARSGYSHFLLS